MEQVQPLSKEKSPATLLSGDARGKAAPISDPLVLEAKLSNDDRHGSAPAIHSSNSLEKAPQKKPKTPKRNFNNTIASRAYVCKYCYAEFDTVQSLGGHQKAHRTLHAAKRRAREMERIANAFSQVNPDFDPYYFGLQAIPVPGHTVAYGPHPWGSPTDVIGPAYGGMLKPITITNTQAVAWHQPAMVNQLNGMVYQPMNCNGDPNFPTTVSPRSTGPKPPPADVLADGSSLSTQELENEGLDLSLRL